MIVKYINHFSGRIGRKIYHFIKGLCFPHRNLFFFHVSKSPRERRCHAADEVVNLSGSAVEIDFTVRCSTLVVPGVKILGVRPYGYVSLFISRKQLLYQIFGTDHVLVLRRADIVLRGYGKHLCGKYIGAVRLFVIAEQV